jgi:hypothetical protein
MIRPMTKTSLLLLTLCLLPVVVDREPPREFTLIIDGESHRVLADHVTTLTVGEHEHRVELTVQPYRTFSHDTVSFRYPQNMSYAFDGSGGHRSWDIDGNDVALMLHQYDGLDDDALRELFVDSIIDQVAGLEVTQEQVSTRFGEETHTGTRLRVRMTDIESIQEIYTFSVGDLTYALVLVDTVEPGEGHTPEFQELFSILTKTFTSGT